MENPCAFTTQNSHVLLGEGKKCLSRGDTRLEWGVVLTTVQRLLGEKDGPWLLLGGLREAVHVLKSMNICLNNKKGRKTAKWKKKANCSTHWFCSLNICRQQCSWRVLGVWRGWWRVSASRLSLFALGAESYVTPHSPIWGRASHCQESDIFRPAQTFRACRAHWLFWGNWWGGI